MGASERPRRAPVAGGGGRRAAPQTWQKAPAGWCAVPHRGQRTASGRVSAGGAWRGRRRGLRGGHRRSTGSPVSTRISTPSGRAKGLSPGTTNHRGHRAEPRAEPGHAGAGVGGPPRRGRPRACARPGPGAAGSRRRRGARAPGPRPRAGRRGPEREVDRLARQPRPDEAGQQRVRPPPYSRRGAAPPAPPPGRARARSVGRAWGAVGPREHVVDVGPQSPGPRREQSARDQRPPAEAAPALPGDGGQRRGDGHPARALTATQASGGPSTTRRSSAGAPAPPASPAPSPARLPGAAQRYTRTAAAAAGRSSWPDRRTGRWPAAPRSSVPPGRQYQLTRWKHGPVGSGPSSPTSSR